MKKRYKLLIVFLIILASFTFYILILGRYYGVKPGKIGSTYGSTSSLSNEIVIKNARKLKYVIYDFSMGSCNNYFSNFGFIVCADLIDIAFSKSGYPIESEMKKDYLKNKSKYNLENGINDINTKYFYRRSRNIKQFCMNKGFYIENCTDPHPGDIIFYGNYHVALVTTEIKNGYIQQIEALPNQLIVMELRKKWKNNSVGRIKTDF
jgi:hypothetical protein